MTKFSIWRKLLVALSAIGISGCAIESPSAPMPAGDLSPGIAADLLDGVVTRNVLKRTSPLEKDITVSARIDSRGGAIAIPEAGLQVTIPAGAVATPTTFTVTALKGNLVAYEFGPHGITFPVGLTARQDLASTEWSLLAARPLVAGYFAERRAIDLPSGTAALSEIIRGVLSPASRQFSFRIDHFSGYVVAW